MRIQQQEILKFLLQLGMLFLIYLMALILLQTLKITSSLSSKNSILTENPPMQTYPSKIKNRITFKIKSGYKSELLTPETVYVDKDKDNLKLPK